MADWAGDDGWRWRPLAPFGIEIDADLCSCLEGEAAGRFTDLYRGYGLIVARNQRLDMEAQTALLSHLGPILRRAGESGYISTDNGGASLSELRFHADGAYAARPLDALSLHAVEVVDGASSTRFVSAELARQNLAADLRESLSDLRVRMISPAFEILGERSCDIVDPPFMQTSIKPLVYRHEGTGSACLWASEMHAAAIEDMDREEGQALLHRLFDSLYDESNLLEHHWHRGDIIIWDNIRYQHARGPLTGVGRRVLQRVIVGTEGEAPHIGTA
ncbi:MAG TPA: TauD/TfdA family dioxygenase [Sphingobium sp.]|uniref:TauD/TfdA dioxygenase family protein n=1 Tax=Sphingobium sp. TaxID=1912891 RepID=UPI002ECFC3A0